MATKKRKTIILRSLYDFGELASTELIQNDKDAHDDPEAAAFFSFDASNQVFCAEIDQDDQDTTPQFLTRMAEYIEHHESNQLGFEDEPRIRPVEGTVMADIIPEESHEESAEQNVLLQYQSDEESDDQDALDGLLHLTTYWQPAKGNIGILPAMYAKDITRLTGSSLFAEEAEKRYRIFQGNFNLAHEKLLRLEPLLEIFEKQSSSQSFPTGNLLIWPPNQPDSRMEFVSMDADHPGYQRVIVDRVEHNLSRKVIGELRLWDSKTQEFHVPRNLQKEANKPTVTFEASKLWDAEVYAGFGDPKNMDPIIITSNATSADTNDPATSQERPHARIAAWTNNVVHLANPDIAPEAPMESVAPARRRVAMESDSEDEEPSIPTPEPVPSAAEGVAETPSVSLSEDEDLMEAESQPVQDSKSLPSPLLDDNKSTLIDLSEEVNMDQADEGSEAQSETRSASLHEGHEVDMIAESHQGLTPGHEDEHDNTNVSGEPADDLPSQSNAFLNTEAQSHLQAEEPTEAEELTSSATDIASLMPEAPSVSSFARPSFSPGEHGYGSSTRPFRGQRGQRGYRGRMNSRYRGDGRRGTGETYDQSQSQRVAQFDTIPRGLAADFYPRGNGRLRGRYPSERATRSRGIRGQRAPYSALVDLGAPSAGGRPSTVPPGLECSVPLMPAETTDGNLNQSSDCGERPPPNTAPSELELHSSVTSRSSGSGLSRLRFSEEGSDYVTTFIPKLDQSAVREKSLQQVQEAIAAMNKKAEEKSPKLHSTMRQKGRNPGRVPAKQETEAEKKARIAAVLAEAYPSPTSTPPRSQAASPKPDEMSKWKRDQIKKKSAMAEVHPKLVATDLRAAQTKKLITLLEPAFESGRAFSGELTFELQFGQVLITPGPQLRDQVYHSVNDWNSCFGQRPGPTHTFSNFTKILTSNGADIDRVLEMKGSTGNGIRRLWNPSPGPQSVSYEFHCQSRSNEDFQIVIDQSGSYELRKGLVTVGDVNVHVPAQVWDLSATLTGPLKWPDPPETVAQSVSAFVESLYVLPGRNKLQLVFRQPNDQEIQVRNLVVKRDSYHSNNLPDGQDILLKATEAKNLQFRVHPEDKRLWQGYEDPEKAYKDFADGGHIHYEMSLVHNGINDVLAKNKALEIGELTDPETTGKSLLVPPAIRSMLDIAVQTVSKMDFVGLRNYGTQQRLADKARKDLEQLEAILGSKAQTILQFPNIAREPSHAATSRSPMIKNNSNPAGGTSVVPQHVPGIRMNTEAQVMVDGLGHRYRLGLGGARIPLVDEEIRSGSGESVIPDDSASQVGAQVRSAPIGYKFTERHAGFW
ncbi:uncharacterized protein PV07_11414 [Cladophialophora immunda]|uniref:Uncharacterized protein n=1 Tax=Cladophialophora immunda TaxID=569365 RepID=A0A0D2CHZ5_9EURO|nr:uncharacterized protein PV07_11414 [Cladophialophora immunda]KIW23194.1 hypothetical protein PV07_11414 [Cladophialophora immunda]OQV07154.1 hypothetical protein CLAIMM_11629 [Cladophialophora immunda]